jgi:hypothetical protein
MPSRFARSSIQGESVLQSLTITRNGYLFTARPYPADSSNPTTFRWAVYRDGDCVGSARTNKDAESGIRSGYFDPRPSGAAVS